jgi:F0F1-type ATP synthase assembly protein I
MNMDVSSLEDDNKPQKAESLQERNERLAEEMQNAFNVLVNLLSCVVMGGMIPQGIVQSTACML